MHTDALTKKVKELEDEINRIKAENERLNRQIFDLCNGVIGTLNPEIIRRILEDQ